MYVAIVTILILIDGFLQSETLEEFDGIFEGHNPYFNRWFSAIGIFQLEGAAGEECHNPYFNRWFSAITTKR